MICVIKIRSISFRERDVSDVRISMTREYVCSLARIEHQLVAHVITINCVELFIETDFHLYQQLVVKVRDINAANVHSGVSGFFDCSFDVVSLIRLIHRWLDVSCSENV